MELKGEDLWSYSRRIESVSSRKCPYDQYIANKAYLSAVTVTSIFLVIFLSARWRRKSAGIDTERNYVNVTLCDSDVISLNIYTSWFSTPFCGYNMTVMCAVNERRFIVFF